MRKYILFIFLISLKIQSYSQIYGNEGETEFYLKFERDAQIVNNLRALYSKDDFFLVGMIDLRNPLVVEPSALYYRKKDVYKGIKYSEGKFYILPLDVDKFESKMYYKIKCDCTDKLFSITEYGYVHRNDTTYPDLGWLYPNSDYIFTRMYQVVCEDRDFLSRNF